MVPPTVPGAYLGIPEKGTMRKQKSIGMMLIFVFVCTCLCVHCLVLLACHNILLVLRDIAVCAEAIWKLIIDKLELASQQSVLSGNYTGGH